MQRYGNLGDLPLILENSQLTGRISHFGRQATTTQVFFNHQLSEPSTHCNLFELVIFAVFLRQRCYDIICQELSFDVFTDASRSFFADLARALDGWMPHHQTVGLTELHGKHELHSCTRWKPKKEVKVLLLCFFCSLYSCKSEGRGKYGEVWHGYSSSRGQLHSW